MHDPRTGLDQSGCFNKLPVPSILKDYSWHSFQLHVKGFWISCTLWLIWVWQNSVKIPVLQGEGKSSHSSAGVAEANCFRQQSRWEDEDVPARHLRFSLQPTEHPVSAYKEEPTLLGREQPSPQQLLSRTTTAFSLTHKTRAWSGEWKSNSGFLCLLWCASTALFSKALKPSANFQHKHIRNLPAYLLTLVLQFNGFGPSIIISL